SVTYDCRSEEETPGLFNTNHINASDISVHMVMKVLNKDSLNASIKRLSLKEHSGLTVDRLQMKLECGPRKSLLHDFVLRMPGTDLQLGNIDATYRLENQRLVIPSLNYTGSILNSSITPSDLACFNQGLKNFKNKMSLSCKFYGQGDELVIPTVLIGSEAGDINLSGNGWMRNLEGKPEWYADIHDLSLSAKTVGFISENLKGQRTEVPAILSRLGSIHVSGITNGTGLDEIKTNTRLSSDAGHADVQLSLSDGHNIKGSIIANDINLRRLLDNPTFGLLTTNIDVEGHLPEHGTPQLKADGIINQLECNHYIYNNIVLNGTYDQEGLNGQLQIDDPNISIIADCSVQRNGKQNNVSLTASILSLLPSALNLTDQWGDANFVADIEANYSGTGLGDAVGNVAINNFSMFSTQGSYEMDRLLLESGYDNDSIHYISMNSDFGRARLTGDFDYSTIGRSFTNAIARCLPTLPGLPPMSAKTNNNFSLEAYITRSDWVQRLANFPLHLEEPITLKGTVNDAGGQIALECDAPLFYINDNGYGSSIISISSPGDSLLYDMRTQKLPEDPEGDYMDIHFKGYACDNLLTAFLDWDNYSDERMSGNINATASFDVTLDGQQMSYVTISPSTLNIKNTVWTVEPTYIVYYDKHLDINQFAIRHEDQYLTLSGTASAASTDTLNIDMRDIDVEYILQLVNFDAVDFSGLMSGHGSLRSLFDSPEADARLQVSQFEFEHGRMGTLNAEVDWNKELEQIDIRAISDDGPDAKTYINGYVSPKRDSINLMITAEGTYLDFAQSFTSSFISHIDGRAQGSVNLIGPLSAINLTGELILNGQAHVKTLGCSYEMRSDTLRCIPNEMQFVNCEIYDMNGHRGILTGGIHHDCLTNLTYDIYADADNLLAYNFHEFGEDTFYGTAYATGRIGIHGRDNELRIEGDVTPRAGTVFVYNAANPDAIANQEFITWGTKTEGRASSGRSVRRQASTAPDFRSDVYINLSITATNDATVRLLMDARTNDYITLHGTGVLNTAYYNKGGFQMFGTYRVSSGTYEITIQDIIKKNFTFADGGTAVFSGDPYDATLNMQAQYTVNGVSLSDLNVGRSFSNTVRVNCLMNIEGQVKAPAVSFDLDLPNVNTDEKQMVRSILNGQEEMNQQVVYLLAVGRFYPQGANNATEEDANERSQTSLAMQSLLSGTLSGQINSVLNSVINNNNWNFGANISTGDEGWNNAEYEGLISGRMLNNRLLINGQFGYRDNATTTDRSFIGDFDIRYLLLPSGNLALKVYNQTNDRYFTRSSLNTQGIGVIMKKDFDGLRDFFGIVKRKNNKKRKK
ncbi:MAG: translocation/assembly module TamB, partial [Prevotella sp.]|nr:translocation/assembly module TamB [Prevotella sp.]